LFKLSVTSPANEKQEIAKKLLNWMNNNKIYLPDNKLIFIYSGSIWEKMMCLEKAGKRHSFSLSLTFSSTNLLREF
jgi:predicted GH43/DUF377 family glycosyl hydrolase